MRGNQKVLQQLNAGLRSELTAIVQYMVQAELQANWGYKQLSEETKKRAIEEMKHAEEFIERIVFFDALPEVNVPLTPNVGDAVPQQFEIDLKDEHQAVHDYNEAVRVCTEEKDDGTRDLFTKLIHDEERHTDYLESQLQSIKDMGLANYLAQKMEE